MLGKKYLFVGASPVVDYYFAFVLENLANSALHRRIIVFQEYPA